MPQILRKSDDTINVTVDASNASYPTLVVLPEPPGEVWISPLTNIGRFSWDSDEGATATHTFPVAAGTIARLPIPPVDGPRKRHAMTLRVATALADGEYLTFRDGTNTLTLEADPGNDGVTGGRTEIGTNASSAADQAAGIAAALNAGTIDIRAEVDAEDTAAIVMIAQTAVAVMVVTGATETTAGPVKTIDAGTGIVTVTDYGHKRPILAVLSATTSTVISVASVSSALTRG